VKNPIACGLEFGKASLMREVATGRIQPRPVVCRNRPKRRIPIFGARAHTRDPKIKAPIEIIKMRLAPKISPALPPSGMNAVAVNWLMVSIHPAMISDICKSVVIWGKATLIVVPLMATSKIARLVTPKMRYLVTGIL
jgi:hypothetical protein